MGLGGGGVSSCAAPTSPPGWRWQRAVTFGARHAGVGPQLYSFGASAVAVGPGEHLLPRAQPQRGSQKSEVPVAGGEGDGGSVSLNSLSSISTAERGQSLQSPSPRTEPVDPQTPLRIPNCHSAVAHPGAAKVGVPAAVCQQPCSEYQSP